MKVTKEEFEEVRREKCIEVWQCTKTRKCGWEGLHSQLAEKVVSEIESKYVCPHCGNEEFYTEFISEQKATNKFVQG